jgi:zinc transport system ATP-binding protein
MVHALEVEDLGVRFGRQPVLAGVNLAVPEGETLAVIGPNGSGKTILFKALIGAVPAEGAVRWAPGTRLGYVPQKLDIERELPITGHDFLRAKAAVSGGTGWTCATPSPWSTSRHRWRHSRSARCPGVSSSGCCSLSP